VTYALFGEGGGRWLADHYTLPLLAQVPFDLGVRLSGDAGTPVMISGTPAQKAPFERIVDGLIATGKLRLPGAEAAAPSR
jgi:ATP-binding protein involved in chromosome partitioning